MVYHNNISATRKTRAITFLVSKYGNVCFYDKQPFVQEIFELTRTIDHLNCNEQDNRLENLCLCHWECQQKKKTNPEMQIIAMDQLKKNLNDPDFLEIESDRGSVRKKFGNTTEDEYTEGEINRKINQVTDSYLTDHLPKSKPENFLYYTDTLNSITYLLQKETGGRGSQPAVRRAIDARCSSVGEFYIRRENGKRIIRRKEDSISLSDNK